MDTNIINTLIPTLAMKDGVKVNDMMQMVKNIVLADVGMKAVPHVLRTVGNIVKRKKKTEDKPIAKEKTASLHISRIYDGSSSNDLFDAIIMRLGELPQTKYLKRTCNGIYVINNNDVIPIEDDIFIKQLSITFDDKNAVTNCSIEVFSYSHDLIRLRKYLADVERKFIIHKNNQLGEDIFYFDEIPVVLPMNMDKVKNYDSAPSHITFTMSKLQTNKSMNNVFGNSMKKVRQRVNFFLKNRSWYEDKGIPYTLGILMYGDPGCGKTSLIKALSKDCNRHVFNLKLSENTTVNQIHNLFFSERVTVVRDGHTMHYTIPIDKRLIVLEDIDCLSSIVLERETHTTEKTSHAATHSEAFLKLQKEAEMRLAKEQDDKAMWEKMACNMDDGFGSYSPLDNAQPPTQEKPTAPAPSADSQQAHPQKLNLSVILNVLDGVLETPGRIVVMTSNHPEKLDRALVRPGRIDLKVHFEKCIKEEIHEMIEKITGRPCNIKDLNNIQDHCWTPAEVTQKIFENIDNTQQIIVSLR